MCLEVFLYLSFFFLFSLKNYFISQIIGHSILWSHGLDFFLSNLLVVDGLCEYT